MGTTYFTLDQANALLPRIGPVVTRLLQLHLHLRRVAEQLARLGSPVTPSLLAGERPEVSSPAVLRLCAQAQALYEAMQSEIELIERLGGVVKDVETGLIDFYSFLEGAREVLLCWQVGEGQIAYYHDEVTGFRGRQSVEGKQFLAERIAAAPTRHD